LADLVAWVKGLAAKRGRSPSELVQAILMSLTRDDWVKIVVGFGAVVLTVVLNIGVREWYQPDVRYGTGSTYIHPKLAIAIVGVKNFGRSDAENVTITASFADPFTNVSTDWSVRGSCPRMWTV
jgi:hypothetical protein